MKNFLKGFPRSIKRDPFFVSKKFKFRDIENGSLTIKKITPQNGAYIHTFFDICPFSPSQRYLAVTRLPFEDRIPVPGDLADVCVIDLNNQTIKKVYATRAWGMQLGANLQWGKTDRFLYTNDMVNEEAVCIRIDLKEKKTKTFTGPMYHLAPDNSCVISFPLDLMNATQIGYGVPDNPISPRRLPQGAAKNEGLWKTDLKNNKKTLLVSLFDFYKKTPNKKFFNQGTFYLGPSKFNKKGNRIMQVVRCLIPDKKTANRVNPQLFTFNENGKNIKLAIPNKKWGKGHHPNWCPSGEYLLMNIDVNNKMRFCQFKYDGSNFKVLSKKIIGSGHPSLEKNGRYIITDSYPHESQARGSWVPIRLIDLKKDQERDIVYINVGKTRGEIRVDPHPAWSRDYKKICFNGVYRGKRQVFIADLTKMI